MESPEYVKTSLAGAICMGLERGRFLPQTVCTCLNLLLTYSDGCKAACSYCGLSHERNRAASPTFIRVKWPMYSLITIFEALQHRRHPFKRVCVSMVTHSRALQDTCTIIAAVKDATGLPVSGLLDPTVMNGSAAMKAIKAAGADRVGVAIDAATPELFDRHRGSGVKGPHNWDRYWQAVREAVEVFGPYKVGVHLIVGLGETEKEMIAAIDYAYRLGALTHLFSFFPEAGSLMENNRQPPLGQYRRVQLARYLINKGVISAKDLIYNPEGQIIDFGVAATPYCEEGIPFMTSGCPDSMGLVACNRPFGNERASEPMRNYPYVPGTDDISVIKSQLWDGVKHIE